MLHMPACNTLYLTPAEKLKTADPIRRMFSQIDYSGMFLCTHLHSWYTSQEPGQTRNK